MKPPAGPDPAVTAFERTERDKRHRIEARLLKTLWRSEGHRRLAESNILGVIFADTLGGISSANDEFLRMVGYKQDDVASGALRWDRITPPEHSGVDAGARGELEARGICGPYEKEFIARDGHRVPVLIGAALLEGSAEQVISFVLDLTERRRAEEQARLFSEELRLKNAQLEEDLRMAREIQQALLPQSYPVFPLRGAPGESALRFSHRYVPAGPVGGDFFDVLALSDHEALVLICDVMGHGVRAALVTAMMRTLVEQLHAEGRTPGELLAALNRGLISTLRRTGSPMFVTALCLILDTDSRMLRFANAGHPHPLHLRRSRGAVEALQGPSGPALGFLEELTYPTCELQLAPLDGLLLFTDGLYEVDERISESVSCDRLPALATRLLGRPLPDLLDGLLDAVREQAVDGHFLDDVCVVGIELAR